MLQIPDRQVLNRGGIKEEGSSRGKKGLPGVKNAPGFDKRRFPSRPSERVDNKKPWGTKKSKGSQMKKPGRVKYEMGIELRREGCCSLPGEQGGSNWQLRRHPRL